MMLPILLVSAAFAREELADVDVLIRLGRTEEALSRSAAHLGQQPDDLGMIARHALAVAAVGEAPELVATLAPGRSPSVDLAYAVAVLHGVSDNDTHCEAISDIYAARATGPIAWELERHRPRAVQVCGERLSADGLPEGDVPEGFAGLALARALEDGPVPLAWGAAVEAHIREAGWDMALFAGAFADSARGEGLVRARVALAARSEQVVPDGSLAELWAARELRLAQGLSVSDIDAAAPGLATPPAWNLFGPTRALGPPRGAPSELEDALRLAISRGTAEQRLDHLQALDARLPPDGALRARWWSHVARAQEDLGHARRALLALEAAWEATPWSGVRANAFAWEAARQGRRLKPALAAIDGALAARAPYYATRGGPSADGLFRWEQGHEVSAWLDTRGWLRFQLGDLGGARSDLDRALMLTRSPRATLHLHAGILAAEAQDVDAALFHLREGLALADARHDDPAFVSMAWERLEPLYAAHRWHPDGVQGWLDGVREAPHASEGEPIVDLEAFSDALISAPIALAVEGMPVPDFLVDVNGSPHTVQELGGWRILDLWAPWCLPCHEQMGVLHEMVAELDAADIELTVVVISVEEAPSPDWSRALGVLSSDRWVLGWSGPELVDTLGSPGLPTTLLVAPDGRVVRARTGWFGDLDWLRDALAEEGVWP